jgi:hypothetical protein
MCKSVFRGALRRPATGGPFVEALRRLGSGPIPDPADDPQGAEEQRRAGFVVAWGMVRATMTDVMEHRLPNHVSTQRTVDGMLYRLPKRTLVQTRSAGWVLVGFGAAATAFMIFWMWGPLSTAFESEGPIQWFTLMFGLLGLPGLAVGLGMLVLGLAMATDALRSEILVGRDTLSAIEWVGPIPWKRTRKLADIERLVLTRARTRTREDVPPPPAAGKDLQAIRAEGAAIKPMLIAAGYPRPLLESLAQQVSAAVESGRPARLFVDHAPDRIQVVDEAPPEPAGGADETVPPQPSESQAVLEQRPTGISLVIPSLGLGKGSKGLFVMSILWLVLCLGVFGAAGYGMLNEEEPDLKGILIMGAFALVFIGVGVAMLLSAVHLGLGQAALVTHHDELLIKRVSPLQTREYRFLASELAAIRVGPNGMEVNDVPVMELQIHPKVGKKVGLLSQLDDAELEWIAAILRRTLGVPRTAV